MINTVCTTGWNVSTESGGSMEGVKLSVFKGFDHRGNARYGEHNGKVFATREAADAFALEHGYTQRHYKRPNYFISLGLPRASRNFLIRTGRVDLLPKMLGERGREWFATVGFRDCKSELWDQPEAIKNRNAA